MLYPPSARFYMLAVSAVLCSSVNAAELEETTLDAVTVTAETEVAGENSDSKEMIAQETAVGKLDTHIMDIPRSVSVITEKRMEEQQINTVQEALEYSAGVYAGAFGNDVRGDWSYIRGTTPEQYIDGLRSLFGWYNNTRAHPDTLSRVEVLKGPAAVEYGQGCIGGLVNLQSKLPQAERLNEIKAEYGSFNYKQLTGDFAGKIDDEGRFLYRLVAIGRDSDTQVNHVEDNSVIIQPSITWNMRQDTSLTLLANFQDTKSGTSLQFLPLEGTIYPGPNGKIGTKTFLSEPGWDRYNTSQNSFTALFDHKINDTLSLDVRARYTRSEADYNSMYPDFTPTILPGNMVSRTAYVSYADAEALTSDIRLKAKLKTGVVDHNAAVGIDMQDSMTDNDSYYGYGAGGLINIYHPVYGNIPTNTPITDYPENNMRQTGFYFTDNMTILDKWTLALGGRYDTLSSKTVGSVGQNDQAFTFNTGLMYHFDNGIAPYVSYAQSFEPVIGTRFGGDAFKPTEGEQYEAGIKYQPVGTNSLFTASVFDIVEKNRTTADPVNINYQVQTGEVHLQGFELEAQTDIDDFNILANYSFLDGEVTRSNDGTQGQNVPYVPDHLASAWVTWKPSDMMKGFKAGAGVRYVGNTYGGNDDLKTPTYTLYDAMVGYDLNDKWGVQLNARNLADKTYIASCGSRGDCAYGQRRTIIANTTYRF